MSQRVLVSGATGFLGGNAARSFAAGGMEVIGLGRDLARGSELESSGVRFAPVSLSDTDGLTRICQGVGTVVHCAALSTAWATREAYVASNVVGTRNLVAASVVGGAKRFVHVSSPSVLSRFEHQFDLTEDEPLPKTFTSLYGETKAAAERIVAACQEFETAIARPKAIVGPGDRALLPRLVQAAESGRLRVIGDGTTLTDMTHVNDVVQALSLMVTAPRVSGIYHVAGAEPVRLWELIGELLTRLGYRAPERRLSIERALRVGRGLETLWTALRLRGEPPLTRYKAAILGFSQTLDAGRIRTELGYQPRVTLEEGLNEIVDSLQSPGRPSPGVPGAVGGSVGPALPVTLFNTGVVRPPAITLGRMSFRRARLPVMVAAIDHHSAGLILYDSGFGVSMENAKGAAGSLYRLVLRPESPPVAESLVRAGLDPARVSWVVVSHLDPDHSGGLAGLPDAGVILDTAAWASLSERARWWQRLARRGLPGNLAGRVRLIDTSRGPVDLLGDGSIRAIALPGHAAGQIGLQVATPGGSRLMLSADAVLRIGDLEHGLGFPYTRIAKDRGAAQGTRKMLQALATDGMVVVPSHCPDSADRLAGDWRSLAPSGDRNGRNG